MTEIVLHSDVPNSLGDQMELAKALASSGLLPAHLAGKPANILAIMYAAQAVGVPLWTAMQTMQVISGKVGISADLARALILRAGHTFRVTESTTERATVEVVRKGEDYVHTATFTIDDAHTAKLAGKGAWLTYPLAMLVARATTLVARQACADVLAGMSYTAEELGADVDEEGRIVDGLPRNADGSISRSRTTDEEKAAAGLMTSEQLSEHTAIQVKKDAKKAERASGPVEDDRWVDQPAGHLDLPTPESTQWCDKWREQLAVCVDEKMIDTQLAAARKAHSDGRILTQQLGSLVSAAGSRKREIEPRSA